MFPQAADAATEIDNVVMQSLNNEYYLFRNEKGQKSQWDSNRETEEAIEEARDIASGKLAANPQSVDSFIQEMGL